MAPSRLSEALREGTRELHAQVERSGLMQSLLRGRIDLHTYCALLRNLHEIYRALESALARQGRHPWIAPVMLAGLPRAALLAQDLVALRGESWEADLAVVPGARQYVRHLQELESAEPGRLLAHAYVRYLGDLSGGQILRRIVAATLRLAGPSGIRFYDFGSPDTAADLARRFRGGLDAVALDAAGVEALRAEARRAFELHRPLFEELQPSGDAGRGGSLASSAA
jgi:heme oxygenase